MAGAKAAKRVGRSKSGREEREVRRRRRTPRSRNAGSKGRKQVPVSACAVGELDQLSATLSRPQEAAKKSAMEELKAARERKARGAEER